jgi:hypothetical protein
VRDANAKFQAAVLYRPAVETQHVAGPSKLETCKPAEVGQIPWGSEFSSEFFCFDPSNLQILPKMRRFAPHTREACRELREFSA